MNRYEYVCRIDDLGVTVIENIFINHYLPNALGDYVKVYLYALKLSSSSRSVSMSDSQLASALNLTEKDVVSAWEYWESENVISVINTSDTKIIRFENLASVMFGGKKIPPKEPAPLSHAIENMLLEIESKVSRTLAHNERDLILSWVDEYNIAPQAAVLLVEDCLKRNVRSINYWDKIASVFFDEGISTYDQALDFFEKRDERYQQYKEILKYLGLYHNPSEPERRLMDNWLDTLSLDIETIKNAADETVGANRPNLKYLDAIIQAKISGESPQTARSRKNNLRTTGTEINYNYDDLEEYLVMDFDKYSEEEEDD